MAHCARPVSADFVTRKVMLPCAAHQPAASATLPLPYVAKFGRAGVTASIALPANNPAFSTTFFFAASSGIVRLLGPGDWIDERERAGLSANNLARIRRVRPRGNGS